MKITFAPVSTPAKTPDLGHPANIVQMHAKTSAVTTVRPEVSTHITTLRSFDRLTVSSFGKNVADEVSRLGDEVLKQTTASDMGEFGKSLTTIINLTEGVDPNDLNLDKSKGIFGKAISMFKKSRTEVMAHFQSISDQIEQISKKLETNVEVAKDQIVFLEKMFDANMDEFVKLGDMVEALDAFKLEEEAVLIDMKAVANPDPVMIHAIRDQDDFVNKIDKQADRLRRSQHMCDLAGDEIRRIQNGNLDSIDNLTVIREQTLPAWKKIISLACMGQALQERLELGNTIMDKTNEMQRKLADMNGANAVAAAKLSQRSSVDIETMQYAQKALIDSSRKANAFIEAGKKDRAEAVKQIGVMRTELRNEFTK